MAAATIVLIVGFLSLQTHILAVNARFNGLYDPKEFVVVFDNPTLDKSIHNSPKAWFVEFYSSYCGHCINFAPAYSKFAVDVKDWKSIIDVAAIDCSRSENMVTCRDHDVNAFPSMKIFNPFTKPNTTGPLLYKGGRSIEDLRHGFIKTVEDYQPDTRLEKTWPNLKPVNASWIVEFFGRHNVANVKYLAVVFEDSVSYIGRELIMDMIPHRSNIVVYRTLMAGNPLVDKWLIGKFPSLFVIEASDISPKALSLSGTREIFNQRLLLFLGIKPHNISSSKDNQDGNMPKDDLKVTAGDPKIALQLPKDDFKLTGVNPKIALQLPEDDLKGGNTKIALQLPKDDIEVEKEDTKINQQNTRQLNKARIQTEGAQIQAVNVAKDLPDGMEYIDKEGWKLQPDNQAPDDFNAGPIANQDEQSNVGMRKEESVQIGGTAQSHQEMWNKIHEKGRERADSMVLPEGKLVQKPPIYMIDLESTLHYALRHEIPLHGIIKEESLEALTNFVSVLARYFPGRPQVMNYLEGIRFWLADGKKDEISSDEWLIFVNRQYDPAMPEDAYLPKQISWIGCEGSQPKYRRYPCGLWSLFHSLTVSHVSTNRMIEDPNVFEVLSTMRSFIKHFFSCQECSQNFAKESMNLKQEVKTLDDSILWLWKTHNRVNKRLHGDNTEDPNHPKKQFPPPTLCPSCRQGEAEPWLEKNVLVFLKDFYGLKNINFDNLESELGGESSQHRVTKGETAEEVKRRVRERFRQKEVELRLQRVEGKLGGGYFGLGVNSLDLSMCFVLYVSCAMLVTFIYMMIWRRRRRRVSKFHV